VGGIVGIRSPGFKVVEGIDHAAADLPVTGAGAVGAVLLEGAARQTEVTARFGVRR